MKDFINNVKKNIKSYSIVFIFGFLFAGIGAIFLLNSTTQSNSKQIRDYQATIINIESTNRRLQKDYQGLAATNSQLESQLSNRQAVINSIDRSVIKLATGLNDSTDTIQSIISTISDIENILRN